MIDLHKPMLLLLQETKLDRFDSMVISSICGHWLSRGVGMESIGSAGGMITLWNDDFFFLFFFSCLHKK